MNVRPLPGAAWLGFTISFLAASPTLAQDFPDDLAAGEGAVRLDPIGPWNLDFGENRCRLTGLFGSEEEKHLLLIDQAAPGGAFGLTLTGPQMKAFYNAPRLSVGHRSDSPMRESDNHGHGLVEGFGSALIFTNFKLGDSKGSRTDSGAEGPSLSSAGIDLEAAGEAARIVVEKGESVVSFETGNLAEPLQALNVCTTDLLTQWGLDAEKHRAYVPPDWTNRKYIVRRIMQTYSDEALLRGEMAVFRMRVIIGLDGTVEDCHLERSTEAKHLDPGVCREMRRARFEPARDTTGAPMRSFYTTTITYAMN